MEWDSAINAWLLVLAAAGRPSTTLKLRRYQLGRLATAVAPLGPWEVTAETLVAWVGSQVWQNETRRSWRAALRGFYGWAHAAGHVTRNPALVLPSVKPSPPNPRPTPEDVYHDARVSADDRVRLMLDLGAQYGMRRGEVCQVHTRDLERDLTGWTLIVHGKGGKDRRLPCSDAIAARIRLAGGDDGYAFPGAIDGHLSAAWCGKLMTRQLRGAYTAHTLRHRFATLALDRTLDLVTVSEACGHSSIETTRRYTLRPDRAMRALIETVGAAS